MPLNYEHFLTGEVCSEYFSVEHLKILLGQQSMQKRGGEHQLHAVALWIEAGQRDDGLNDRLGHLKEVIPFIRFERISLKALVDVLASDYAMVESKENR